MKSFSRISLWLGMIAIAAALALPVRANTWPLPPPGSRLVGQNQFHVVENNGGSLEAIAKKYNVGFLALLQANPGVDPYVPRAGSVLTIPLQTLLPDAPREGLVLNLAELRLSYYPPGKNEVTVYPIGIGQLGGDTITPTMVTTVSDKRANPTWTLAACRIAPEVKPYLIPSHYSAEKGARTALMHLELEPYLNMGMRLGEGSGAALAMPIVEAACAMYHEMGMLAASNIVLPKG